MAALNHGNIITTEDIGIPAANYPIPMSPKPSPTGPVKGDLLINLRQLPPLWPLDDLMQGKGIETRKAQALEVPVIQEFLTNFESPYALGHLPTAESSATYFLAINQTKQCVGVIGVNSIRTGVIFPIAVDEQNRNRGIGFALLLTALHFAKGTNYLHLMIPDIYDETRLVLQRKGVASCHLKADMASLVLSNLVVVRKKSKKDKLKRDKTVGKLNKLKKKSNPGFSSSSSSSSESSSTREGPRRRDKFKSRLKGQRKEDFAMEEFAKREEASKASSPLNSRPL